MIIDFVTSSIYQQMGVLVDLRESKIAGIQMGQLKIWLYNIHLRHSFF